MSEQANKQTADSQTPDEKIKAVNQILQDSEPGDISTDAYSGNAGYKPQFIIDAMNKVFGIGGWGFDQLSEEIVTSQTEKGTSSLAVVQVRVWIKVIVSMPIGWGQARVTKGDLGDAKKGAQTDALKKALSYFSIGNRAYHGMLKAS